MAKIYYFLHHIIVIPQPCSQYQGPENIVFRLFHRDPRPLDRTTEKLGLQKPEAPKATTTSFRGDNPKTLQPALPDSVAKGFSVETLNSRSHA